MTKKIVFHLKKMIRKGFIASIALFSMSSSSFSADDETLYSFLKVDISNEYLSSVDAQLLWYLSRVDSLEKERAKSISGLPTIKGDFYFSAEDSVASSLWEAALSHQG